MELPEQALEVTYIEEPDLIFGYGQVSDHPKDGLFLYGPHSGPSAIKRDFDWRHRNQKGALTIQELGDSTWVASSRSRRPARGKKKTAFICRTFLAWRKPSAS